MEGNERGSKVEADLSRCEEKIYRRNKSKEREALHGTTVASVGPRGDGRVHGEGRRDQDCAEEDRNRKPATECERERADEVDDEGIKGKEGFDGSSRWLRHSWARGNLNF